MKKAKSLKMNTYDEEYDEQEEVIFREKLHHYEKPHYREKTKYDHQSEIKYQSDSKTKSFTDEKAMLKYVSELGGSDYDVYQMNDSLYKVVVLGNQKVKK